MPAITGIQIFPLRHPQIKAHATIVLDDCFVISGLKIVDGCNGLFVAMPVTRKRDGQFQDLAYPLTRDFNRYLEQKVLFAYQRPPGDAIYSGRADESHPTITGP